MNFANHAPDALKLPISPCDIPRAMSLTVRLSLLLQQFHHIFQNNLWSSSSS